MCASGAVSDVRLKLNVLVVGMMGGGVMYPPVSMSTACADPGIFVRGGPGQLKFEYSSVLKRACLVAGILKLNHSCCHWVLHSEELDNRV